MRRLAAVVLLGAALTQAHAQTAEPAGPQQQYLAEQKALGKAFGAYFYPRYSRLYALLPAAFVAKVDSAQRVFDDLLDRYAAQLTPAYVQEQRTENRYYFDRLLLEYPSNHHTYAGLPPCHRPSAGACAATGPTLTALSC